MTNNDDMQPTVRPVSGVRQFGTILCYELKGCLLNKVFIGFTIFLIVAIAVITFFRGSGSWSMAKQQVFGKFRCYGR